MDSGADLVRRATPGVRPESRPAKPPKLGSRWRSYGLNDSGCATPGLNAPSLKRGEYPERRNRCHACVFSPGIRIAEDSRPRDDSSPLVAAGAGSEGRGTLPTPRSGGGYQREPPLDARLSETRLPFTKFPQIARSLDAGAQRDRLQTVCTDLSFSLCVVKFVNRGMRLASTTGITRNAGLRLGSRCRPQARHPTHD